VTTHLPELSFGQTSRPYCPRDLAASDVIDREEASDEGDDEKHQRDIQGHSPPERPLGST
jgi:hypothetical protein